MEGKLLYADLTYTLRGILYSVHNDLGQYKNEKQYADAVGYLLQQKGINYEREKVLEATFFGEKSRRSQVDFLIESKIILELKTAPRFIRKDYQQCLRYVTSARVDLALLVNFRTDSCTIKRILNPDLLNKDP